MCVPPHHPSLPSYYSVNMYRMNPSPYIRIYIENYISPYVYKSVFTIIDVWSLDFFRYQLIDPMCVSSSLSNIQVLILELIPPVDIFILILLTYMLIELHARNVYVIVQLWKPFNKCVAKRRRSYDPKASIFNAFATFLLLSYSTVLVIGFHSCSMYEYALILHLLPCTDCIMIPTSPSQENYHILYLL